MTADAAPAFDQEQNVNLISPQLEQAMAMLPHDEAGLCLIAAGLDILPAARCLDHYRAALVMVRARVDALLAELGRPN